MSDIFSLDNGANKPESSSFVIDGLPIEKVTVSCPVAGIAPLQTPDTVWTASRSIVNPSAGIWRTLLNTSSVLARW